MINLIIHTNLKFKGGRDMSEGGGGGGGESGSRSGSARYAFMLSSGLGLRNGGPISFGRGKSAVEGECAVQESQLEKNIVPLDADIAERNKKEEEKDMEEQKSVGQGSGDGGCFVATAVYDGDDSHPNVDRLRQFRDNFLLMSQQGRRFVRFYYGGFGFKMSVFMRKYFPWTLMLLRKIFDLVVPLLPVDLADVNKTVPQILQMDFRKFCSPCVDFLCKEAQEREFDCLCIGLSGGVDSAATAALCKLTGMRVVAVTISGDGCIREQDILDAREIARHLNIEHIVVDLTELLKKSMEFNLPNKEHIIMGIRNAVVKEIAEDQNGLLVGSGVRTELYSGLFSPNSILGAIFPLASLFKTQIYSLVAYLGLPECVLQKPSHSGIHGEDNDVFWGLGYAMFDWVSQLMEQGWTTDCIEVETGVKSHVVEAIRSQKKWSDRFLSFPNFKP